jgi:hypothetical protein
MAIVESIGIAILKKRNKYKLTLALAESNLLINKRHLQGINS